MRFLIATLLLLSSLTARADIFDRINDCEKAGGGQCVYDLLRELARGNQAASAILLEPGTYTDIGNCASNGNNGTIEIRQSSIDAIVADKVFYNSVFQFHCEDNSCRALPEGASGWRTQFVITKTSPTSFTIHGEDGSLYSGICPFQKQ